MRVGCDRERPIEISTINIGGCRKKLSSYNQYIGGLAPLAVHVRDLQFVDFPNESVETLLHCFG